MPKIANIQKYFIEKFYELYDNKYDYSKSNIKRSNSNITVICREHGEFLVTPNNHLSKKSGCPECKKKKYRNKNFVLDSIKIHGDKYDYSKVEYINNRTKVKII